jgi:hypothetical protein
MTQKALVWRGFCTVALLGACSTGVVPVDDEGGGGEVSIGGSGGSGGSGGTIVSPCEMDCSTLVTPDCFEGRCNEGQYPGPVNSCVVVPSDSGAPCDDDQFCTVTDTCDGAGVCIGSGANDCGMQPGECQQVVCNEAAKSCSTQAGTNGQSCTSNDLCLVGTTCQNGLCIGSPKDCFFAPVPNECYVAVCNPTSGICEPEPGNDGQSCIDPNELCTAGKTCSAGTCIGGGPKDCSALTVQCVEGVCDPSNGQCVTTPLLPGEFCSAATNTCNQGICDTAGICQPTPTNEGGVCEDGNPCTGGETCGGGTCTGGTLIPKTTYFSEDFANNTAGWTLGTEWQIGPAVASPPTGACGNGDPGTDHTPTSDNGIAGVVIGGTASTNTHPYYYLTSPIIDTSAAAGGLWLGYWRWLNSDYTRFMNNTVEVFDGATWHLLWESGAPPNVTDAAWTQQAHDVTPYKSSQFRVRFGFEIGSSGVYTCSSWNLDDVEIANVICP